MPTSVRVDEETEWLLERAAQVTAKTKSAVIRLALRQFCAPLVLGKTTTPYDSLKIYWDALRGRQI